jgi:hypothetical protein
MIDDFKPQQGPRPARCTLPEHGGRWHWDGIATWWEERANPSAQSHPQAQEHVQ